MHKPFPDLTASHRRVLDTLVGFSASSRAEIAALTGLTRPAISQIVQDLIEIGLVEEEQARQGMRGQPARPLVIRGAAGYAAGLNFSHGYLELMVLDISGRQIDACRAKIPEPTPVAICDVLRRELTPRLAAHRLDPARCLGIGISLPADFYSDGSLMPHPWFPALRAPNLLQQFQDLLDMPVFLENDGRACAVGERVIGAGTRTKSFMLVHIGHGVGGGLIIDGKPFRGAYGNAGILGQFFPYGEPRPSGQDLLETLHEAGFHATDFDDLEALPAAAEPVVAHWIARAAGQLGPVLAMTGRFFGPEAIIVAGRLPPAITTALTEAMDMRGALPPQDDLPLPKLIPSMLGSKAGMAGAATIPVYRTLLTDGDI